MAAGYEPGYYIGAMPGATGKYKALVKTWPWPIQTQVAGQLKENRTYPGRDSPYDRPRHTHTDSLLAS